MIGIVESVAVPDNERLTAVHDERLAAIAVKMPPQQLRGAVIHRAGMGLFLGYAEYRQRFEDLMRGHLQLPGQLVYADFTHSQRLQYPSLPCVLRVLYGIKFALTHRCGGIWRFDRLPVSL